MTTQCVMCQTLAYVDFWHGAYTAIVHMLPGIHPDMQGSCSNVLQIFPWLILYGYADLDGVMPTHVQDLLPIPEQLTRSAFCIAAMQAHSYFRCLLNDTVMITQEPYSSAG